MDRSRTLFCAVLALALVSAGCTSLVRDISNAPSNEWVLEMTGVSSVHEQGTTGEGVTVAVVDTGVKPDHPDLEGVEIDWQDYVNNRARAYDDDGHGTHVSGLVVSRATGGASDPLVTGTAPGAKLIHLKAISGSGDGEGQDIADAIRQAVRMGAHVIVLSLGEEPRLLPIGQSVEEAANDAIDQGVVVVAAAGNADTANGQTGDDCTVASPGSVPRVIAVGAVDGEKEIARFSCRGDNSGGPLGLMQPEDPNKKPELSAPGVAVVSLWPERRCGDGSDRTALYCVASGTSQATPIVGGIVALLLEENPELKRSDAEGVLKIKQALMNSAEKVGFSGHDDRYGYGIAQADQALAWLERN